MTPAELAELSEPVSAAAEAKLHAVLDRLIANSGYLTGCEQMNARLLATLDRVRLERDQQERFKWRANKTAERIVAAIERVVTDQALNTPLNREALIAVVREAAEFQR